MVNMVNMNQQHGVIVNVSIGVSEGSLTELLAARLNLPMKHLHLLYVKLKTNIMSQHSGTLI